MFKVYISYRRQDSGDIARRIYQYLEKELSEGVVFKDDKIPPGVEWQSFLRETLATADVVIVVIGPDWLSTPSNNQPRLFEPDDFHRSEIETALNSGKLVVPVIVNNAVMPTPADLPDSTRDLYQRMSIRIRNDPYFKGDVDKLANYLRKTLEIDSATESEAHTKDQTENDDGNDKEKKNDGHSLQIILAIIGLISAALVALITVSPALLALLLPTPSPTTIPSPTDAATDVPATPEVIADLDMTATEAMLQLTVDARSTENARLLATNTQIAVQTQTAAASNISASPSETPASSATPTSVPLTSTLSIPHIRETQVAEAISLTQTSIALTSIAIQNAALLATLTPTQNVTPVNATALTIFRSEDSFTLYVPHAEDTLSLVGMEFRVTLMNGETISRRLDRDFAGFLGIPFQNINTLGAVCFHITRAGGIRPVPQACQTGVLLLSQEVAEADAFWRDFSAQLAHTVLIYRGDQLIGACGPQASCPVNWPGGSDSVAVISTQTPGYPCEGTIVFTSGGLLNQVKVSPLRNAPNRPAVQQGSRVTVLESRNSEGTFWYQIRYSYNLTNNVGWIPDSFVQALNCP